MPRTDGPRAALVVEQLWQPVPGGSGTYVRELANGLLSSGLASPVGIRARGPVGDRRGLDPRLPLRTSRLPRRALYESWRRLRSPRAPGWRDVDLIHATTWAVPPAPRPLVVTVHDLAFLREPEHFTPHGAAYFRDALTVTRAEAALVIVPSEATARDCEAAGIGRERIRVIAHGVTAQPSSPDAVADLRRRHGLERPYVLWVGTVEPRKNLPALLRAFGHLLRAGTDLDLVLVGPPGWGEAGDEVRRAVADLGPDRVRHLGRLGQADLQAAYAGARTFCFPSAWEGFGLPVLEAQAHGAPVVTSQGTSMEEICGPSALAVDPDDTLALAAALTAAAGERHDELSVAGRANSARFTWDAAVAATVDAYREVVS
jgi:glycosyltransferase involved in cell wall biosynthesis